MIRALFLKKISLVTIGTAISWYEFFLFIFWAPQIHHIFLSNSPTSLDTLLLFTFGYFLRPLSGLIFGYIGDRFGRKISLTISILLATLPSILIALLPAFNGLGITSFIILQCIRMFQSIPSGSEEPGAMCYLYETAPKKNIFFSSSFSFLGTQCGAILGIITTLLMQLTFSSENLMTYGWRLCFILSAVFGLTGFIIRHKLPETLPFEHLKKEKKILKNPVITTLFQHKKALLIGASISILPVIGFFMATIYPLFYYPQYFKLSITQNFLISLFFFGLTATSLPFYGKLADRHGAKKMILTSLVTSTLLAIASYHCMKMGWVGWCLSTQSLLCFSNGILLALIPAILCHLFPIQLRYTSVGFSFNASASILGGISPIFAFFYTQIQTDPISFIGLFVLTCLIGIWLFTGPRARSILENKHELFFRCTDHNKIT